MSIVEEGHGDQLEEEPVAEEEDIAGADGTSQLIRGVGFLVHLMDGAQKLRGVSSWCGRTWFSQRRRCPGATTIPKSHKTKIPILCGSARR